jgi:hypothetical protein
VTPTSRIWLLGSGFSDLATPPLKVDCLDDGSEGVIEVAAVVTPMIRVLVGADLDCEGTGSSQSPDTRIAQSINSYLVLSHAVSFEPIVDGD